MKAGGVSITGSYHKINQDKFTARAVTGGHVLAVSDGVGSCLHSQAGSAALCSVFVKIADAHACKIPSENDFLAEIHAAWSEKLTKNFLKISDCHATALLAVKNDENIWAFRLGDGFIGVASDDAVFALFDDKKEYFANVTDCLAEDFQPELWQKQKFSCRNFKGIVAATDGVTLQFGAENLKKFTVDFCESYRETELKEILAQIEGWLPTFAGADDKTLAFLLQEAVIFGN